MSKYSHYSQMQPIQTANKNGIVLLANSFLKGPALSCNTAELCPFEVSLKLSFVWFGKLWCKVESALHEVKLYKIQTTLCLCATNSWCNYVDLSFQCHCHRRRNCGFYDIMMTKWPLNISGGVLQMTLYYPTNKFWRYNNIRFTLADPENKAGGLWPFYW